MCGFQTIVSAVGLGVNLLGRRREANAAADAAEADAAAAEENAIIMQENIAAARENIDFTKVKIKDAIYRGTIETKRVAQGGAQTRGRQRAAMAANGIDLRFGSPLDVVYQTTLDVLRDIDTSERNTQSEVDDLEQQKKNYLREVKDYKRQRDNYKRIAEGGRAAAGSQRQAGNLSVLGGALEGASDIYRATIN